jgi:hypothetical protein
MRLVAIRRIVGRAAAVGEGRREPFPAGEDPNPWRKGWAREADFAWGRKPTQRGESRAGQACGGVTHGRAVSEVFHFAQTR